MTRTIKPRLALIGGWMLMLALLLSASAFALDEDRSAPPFTFTTYDGETITNAEIEGQLTVLHFWATWERAAALDALILQAIADGYADEDVRVLGVNHFDPEEDARAFIRDNDLSYPLGPDPQGSIAVAFEMESLPYTVIIGPEGDVLETIDVPVAGDELVRSLRRYDENLPELDASILEAPTPIDREERYGDLEMSLTEEGFPVLGNPALPVRVEDYSSFACPFCRDFHDNVFDSVLERVQQGDAYFIYVPVYITGGLPNREEANRAAMCAAEQDAFWAFADMLFDWHTRFRAAAFNDRRLEAGAEALGLDMDAWNECLASERPDAILETAVSTFRENGYRGTPTIVINGETVPATEAAISAAIERWLGERT